MISIQEIKQQILKSLPAAKIEINDMTGDGSHLKVHVAHSSFAGKTILQQQRLVYDAVGSVVGNEIHAFSLTTEVDK